MKLRNILITLGITITAISVVLSIMFGELWLSPLIIIPYCFSRSRIRMENQENASEQEEKSTGETVPYVDIEYEVMDEKGVKCPRCRTPIKEENLRFCSKCGNKLVRP